MLRRRWPIIVFLVWTAYLWITRIVNAWSSVDETTTAKVTSTVSALVLLVLAIASARLLVVARTRPFTDAEGRVLTVLGGVTIAVWAVRIPQILLDDRALATVPFKVVHVVLGGISIGLAMVTILKARAEHDLVSADPPAGAASPAANAAR